MVKINKWIPLFTTQFLGVLNDNILKNAIIFISIFWLSAEDQQLVIPIASALLVLPFVLFSPLAGKWSQTKSKQRIFEIAKMMEIPIMGVAVIGFYFESINVVMLSMLLMGIQSAIYSPSKYGLIRDIGGVEGVSFGIGTMELLTFVGVLIGQVLTGLISDLPNNSILIISTLMLVLAIIGWTSSKKISAVEPEPTKQIKETVNPIMYLYNSYRWSKSVKGLNYTIFGLGSFWLVASMLQMNIYIHAPQHYDMSNTQTSFVMAMIAIGIGLGCWVAGIIAKNRVEIGMVPIGGLALSICLTIFATTELSPSKFIILLFIAAFFSGFYKVPLNAWLQERVEGRKLGNILAYNNMVAFLFILIAAAIFGLVSTYYDTLTVFVFIAIISWIMTLVTLFNIPAMMVRFMADSIAKFYYKYNISGASNIPKKSGGLLIANHQSLLDSFIIVAAIPRMVRFVMAREIYENPFIHWLVKRMNVIPVTANMGKERLEEFTRLCQKEINNGHLVCIFPEGQISRIGHLLEFKKGVEHIAEGINAPIIPIHLAGISGTPFSFDVGSSKPNVNLRSFRKTISINIGKPISPEQSAFHLRQRVQELTSETFEQRIKGHHTLGYFLSKVAKKNSTKALAVAKGVDFSFSDLYDKASELNQYLATHFSKDKTVGIYAQPDTSVVILNIALAMAGITSINIDPLLIEKNKRKIFKKCDLLIGAEDQNLPLPNGVEFYKINDIMDQSVEIEMAVVNGIKDAKSIHKNDLATIIYEYNEHDQWIEIKLTHQNILASVKGLMKIFNVQRGKRVLSIMPLNKAYGYSLNLWLPLLTGMTIIHSNNSNSINELADTIISQKVNILFATNQMIHQIYESGNKEVWHTLDTIITGQETVSQEIQNILHKEFEISIHESIGFTQYGSVVAVSSPNYKLNDIKGKVISQLGSKSNRYGRPVPGIAIKIVDPTNLETELGANEKGVMMLKGASLGCSTNNIAQDQITWLNSGFEGAIDQDGFIMLDQGSTD